MKTTQAFLWEQSPVDIYKSIPPAYELNSYRAKGERNEGAVVEGLFIGLIGHC